MVVAARGPEASRWVGVSWGIGQVGTHVIAAIRPPRFHGQRNQRYNVRSLDFGPSQNPRMLQNTFLRTRALCLFIYCNGFWFLGEWLTMISAGLQSNNLGIQDERGGRAGAASRAAARRRRRRRDGVDRGGDRRHWHRRRAGRVHRSLRHRRMTLFLKEALRAPVYYYYGLL